ncbi:MAG: GerAB/ArcD/ProY family transporter [Clostridia bacterium]|nr:GerAB/ArcD/ProY family transporter [Clostridia bacterium]
MGREHLSTWEVVCTLSLITLTPVLISFPQYSSREFGNAAVLHSVYLAIVVFIFYLIILKLYEPFAGKDIMDIAEIVGGKPLKIIMSIAVILYTFAMMIFTMQEFGEDIKDVMFNHSTNAEINILFTIGMAFLGYFGIRGVFRLGTYLFPAIVIGFGLMFYSLSSKIDFINLTPVLGTGASTVFLKGLTQVGIYNSLSIMLVIAPLAKHFKKATLFSVLSTSLVIILSLFLLATIIPYPSLNQKNFAIFELTRYIGFGRFFQRLDAVFTFFWIMTCFVFLGVLLIVNFIMLKKAFNLKYPGRLIPCVSLIIFTSCNLVPSNAVSSIARDFMYVSLSPYSLFLYPLILLLLARLKVSGRKKQDG